MADNPPLAIKDSISQIKELLSKNCTIEHVRPAVFASDAEVNLVIVTLVCPDASRHTIKAFREEAVAVREYIRSLQK